MFIRFRQLASGTLIWCDKVQKKKTKKQQKHSKLERKNMTERQRQQCATACGVATTEFDAIVFRQSVAVCTLRCKIELIFLSLQTEL